MYLSYPGIIVVYDDGKVSEMITGTVDMGIIDRIHSTAFG